MLSACIADSGVCPHHSLLGVIFYDVHDAQDIGKPDNRWKTSTEIYEDFLKSGKNAPNLFLIHYSRVSGFKYEPSLDISGGRFAGLQILKIENRNSDLAEAVIQFFTPYVESAEKNKTFDAAALEYLIISYENKNDLNSVKKYLNMAKRFSKFSRVIDKKLASYGM